MEERGKEEGREEERGKEIREWKAEEERGERDRMRRGRGESECGREMASWFLPTCLGSVYCVNRIPLHSIPTLLLYTCTLTLLPSIQNTSLALQHV